MSTTIGHIIDPSWSYDLESSLRVHAMLLQRARERKWRFHGDWVWTGPFETLCGKPCCGSSLGSDCTSSFRLDLHVSAGLESMVESLNRNILKAMCQYPGFASLDERISTRFVHCGDAIKALAAYEGGRTREPLNKYHRRARFVRNVRILSSQFGVHLEADVTLTGSRWDLWSLAKKDAPRWNNRLKLPTWLGRAMTQLDTLVEPKGEPE